MLVALDHLENRITGDEAVQKLDELIKGKRRSGYVRKARIPCSRSEGILEVRRFGAAAGARAVLVKVPPSVRKDIRSDRKEHRSSLRELQLKYGYTEHVVRRILRSRPEPPQCAPALPAKAIGRQANVKLTGFKTRGPTRSLS